MKTTFKSLVALGFMLIIPCCSVFAQVGINTDSSMPDNSAILDVISTTKGFLPPRVSLTAANVASPVTSPANGLFVYNTATSGSLYNKSWKGLTNLLKAVLNKQATSNLGNSQN